MNENKALRIIMAGGGTGGHIFPAIAIANAIMRIAPETQFLFIGAKGKMEMEKIPQAGYEIEGLDIAGFNRSSLIKNISLPLKLAKSFLQAARIFKRFRPDAVIGVGGYSSYPVLRYAQQQHIKTFIHESNSFAGRSNIMLGKRAMKIFTASEEMQSFFPADKVILTGNPVRRAISHSNISREQGLNYFGLQMEKKTVVVIGGSLGARAVNRAIEEHAGDFAKQDLQLIWQTGKPFYQSALAAAKDKKEISVQEFITQPEYAYAAGDMIISRSGAMAVAELCLVKKPVIFVPYPFAAEDHQTANAAALLKRHAALVVKDADAEKELWPLVLRLLDNAAQQEMLSENIAKLSVNNADELIATEVLALIKN